MKAKYKIFIAALFTFSVYYSQDIHFSQLTEAPLHLNPANSGLFDGYLRVNLNYRNQWAVMGQPFKTMAVSVDGVIGEKKDKQAYLGWGLSVFNDEAGASSYALNQATGFVNGIVNLDAKNKFCASVGGGYGQRSANFNTLTYGNQYNGTIFDQNIPSFENNQFNQFGYADVSAGLQWEYMKTEKGFDRDDNLDIKAGIAAWHLNQPRQKYTSNTEERLPMRLVGELTARVDLKGTRLAVLPAVVYMRQASFKELNLGAFLRLRFKNPTKTTGFKHESGISFGGFIRPGDAIIPQLLIDFNGFSVGFSYDYNVSSYKMSTMGNGGLEFSLQWHSLRDALFKRVREFGKGGKNNTRITPK